MQIYNKKLFLTLSFFLDPTHESAIYSIYKIRIYIAFYHIILTPFLTLMLIPDASPEYRLVSVRKVLT